MRNQVNKFWTWNKVESESPELLIYGTLANESWYEDDVTAMAFQEELKEHSGKDIVLRINSPGGDVHAGVAIFSLLQDHKGFKTCKIDGLAASAATIPPMACDKVIMSQAATMMIHNPWTLAVGDANEMQNVIDQLNEIREGIVSAYANKTGMERDQIIDLMDAETWMSAEKAVELGFADQIENKITDLKQPSNYLFSNRAVFNLAKAPYMGISQSEKNEREKIIEENKEILNKFGGKN